MKKILIISGTRADYGIYKPVAQALMAGGWRVSFVVSGMHLSRKYGFTKALILEDGFEVSGEVQSLFLENTKGNMARSVSLELAGFTSIFEQNKPDFVLLLGDRGEMLAAAISCLYLGIKSAHIHGGEVSGTVDESIRHAVSKLSSVHFPATKKSAERLVGMGEDQWRVFPVGAPRIDTILNDRLPSFGSILEKYEWDITPKKYILQVFHPVVTESDTLEQQVQVLSEALEETQLPIICILPNSDAGGEIIRGFYQKNNASNIYYVTNFSPEEYLTILKESQFMIGNSSSGIIEAASFNVPVINLGTRQNGREQSPNTLNAEITIEKIRETIRTVGKKEFKDKVNKARNIYGDGKSAEKIVTILDRILEEKDNLKWIQKKISY
ncbi:UDP-N-acetylglucosamine 2-epimerase [Enterococcus avium]|uniref:UDP-N-acetylglucosamine 2-epimerase n=1 Tax=Enterococcus avium TaxID=33945 RepID=UPI0034D2F13B